MIYNKYSNYFTVLALILAAIIVPASAAEFSYKSVLSNYPNPFDSRKTYTNIVLGTPEFTSALLNIRIYDIFGNPVREFASFGPALLKWDGKDETGNFVSKGGYLCVVSTSEGKIVALRKIGVIH